jgi:asparagine synthase (glutamine-hydrolysing)
MCGIAGVHFPGGERRERLRDIVTRMTAALRHRGPESGGLWLDHRAGVGLGHRRLAILDLSDAGHQPFASASGRTLLSFNGEIYNFAELRGRLDYPFRTRTDTEVLAAALELWGLERTLAELDGMYAFAVWDRRSGQLSLARDRFGEKPLYYSRTSEAILFGSEVRAFEALPGFDLRIDELARDHLLRFGYIAGPRTIWQGIASLPPNHWLPPLGEPRKAAVEPAAVPFSGTETDAIDELHRIFGRAVQSRLVADVPVGVFLSGGVDSSLVTIYGGGVQAFTAGFEEAGFNESAYASQLAAHVGVPHEVWTISASEALRAIPDLPSVFDQPFADSSQIPALLLARHARQHVTVALGGDGGDELFAAYPRYRHIAALARMPGWLRHSAAAVGRVGAEEKAQVIAECAHARDLASLYRGILGGEADPHGAPEDPVAWMCAHDLVNYLPDDLLVKLDRCAMSVALETRLPFLAPEVTRFAASLPMALRSNKRIPRLLLRRHLTKTFADRPKKGFCAPVAKWLRGPLRDWAEDLAPGITATLPAGTRCVRPWSRLMLEAWLRQRGVAERSPLRLPEPVAVPDRCA